MNSEVNLFVNLHYIKSNYFESILQCSDGVEAFFENPTLNRLYQLACFELGLPFSENGLSFSENGDTGLTDDERKYIMSEELPDYLTFKNRLDEKFDFKYATKKWNLEYFKRYLWNKKDDKKFCKKLAILNNKIGKLCGYEFIFYSHKFDEKYVNLRWLYLHNRRDITDISYLANLTSLRVLNLEYTSTTNIEPLGNLINLEELYLADNTTEVENITDCSCLSNLTKLKKLNINFLGKIKNFSFLPNLINLEDLCLSYCHFSNTELLSGLTKLKKLVLHNNNIEDISFLSELINLKILHLNSNLISNLEPLSNLINLEILWLPDNKISDIEPLFRLSKLKKLVLYNNKINFSRFIELNTQIRA